MSCSLNISHIKQIHLCGREDPIYWRGADSDWCSRVQAVSGEGEEKSSFRGEERIFPECHSVAFPPCSWAGGLPVSSLRGSLPFPAHDWWAIQFPNLHFKTELRSSHELEQRHLTKKMNISSKCICHYNITQKSFTALEILCVPSIPSSAPQLLAIPDLSPTSWLLLFPKCHTEGALCQSALLTG